jgi:hypothetical protein
MDGLDESILAAAAGGLDLGSCAVNLKKQYTDAIGGEVEDMIH